MSNHSERALKGLQVCCVVKHVVVEEKIIEAIENQPDKTIENQPDKTSAPATLIAVREAQPWPCCAGGGGLQQHAAAAPVRRRQRVNNGASLALQRRSGNTDQPPDHSWTSRSLLS